MSESAKKDPNRSVYDVEQGEEDEPSWLQRWGVGAALLLALLVVGYIVLFTGHKYQVTAEFQNASQLTVGNQVVIGGEPVGSVTDIKLGDNGQALVTFSVDDQFAPLRRGTVATVRSYSISGVANRLVQLTIPPTNRAGPDIPDGGTMSQAETVSEVDLDQIFNTLDARTVHNLKKVIRGFAISYDGVGPQANRGFKYANPFLSTSSAVFAELNRDNTALGQLVVDTSRLSGAIADRAPDVSALVGNLDKMMAALASQKQALGTSVAELPGFMRQADTTFVNLRAALDDLTPLVQASGPAVDKLGPFLAALRTTAAEAVPTVNALDQTVSAPGPANDLIDLTREQVPLEQAAIGSGAPSCGQNPVTDYKAAADNNFTQGAFGESVCALRNGLPALAFLRAYSNELVGWFDGFSHSNGVVNDATGTIARIGITFNTYTPSPATGLPFIGPGILPKPLSDATNLGILTSGYNNKCPGANERPLGAADPTDHSVPFYPDGSSPYTDPLNCDPTQVAPGP